MLIINKLILPPLLQSLYCVFLVYQGKLFENVLGIFFIHKRDTSVKTDFFHLYGFQCSVKAGFEIRLTNWQ